MIILGYCSASLAAALVLFVGLGWNDLRTGGVIPVFVTTIFMAFVISLYALVPACLAIAYAADRGIRSLWYYVLAGIGPGLMFPLFVLAISHQPLERIVSMEPHGWLNGLTVFVLGGMVGGFVFWGLVGRKCQAE
jgi:hypothetical protein